MVKSEQKRQQKLARKKAKDRKRHQAIIQTRQQTASLHGQMTIGAKGEIVYCGVNPLIKSEGIGGVALARRCPNGLVAYFLVLLDIYCLGVKDAMGGIGGMDDLERMTKQANTEPVSPELARGLVEAAIEFAQQAGLAPHADYRNVTPLWGDIQPASIDGHYSMGVDGKYLYIAGPFDDMEKQRYILSTMSAHGISYSTDIAAVTYRRIDLAE